MRARPGAPARSRGDEPPEDVPRREIVELWRRAARERDVAESWAVLTSAGIRAVRRSEDGYPGRLVGDRSAPEVLFVRGTVEQLEGPCVSIVGTRSATHYGLDVSAELGAELSAAGVVVISGLASGIDASAHEGALAPSEPAPPVAVVGGGVDVVYPARNARLWGRVEAVGGIVSEAAPGTPAEGWRFPLRNRLIAALADVLVVVESHQTGGSMHTVSAADERGVTVLAVPGSVRSPASKGTNSLIAEGCGVARDTADVLAALELACAGRPMSLARPAGPQTTPGGGRSDDGDDTVGSRADSGASWVLRRLGEGERQVLEALEDFPVSFEAICSRSGRTMAEVAVALEHLSANDLAARSGSGWERRPGARR
jgi:DNA processing protein